MSCPRQMYLLPASLCVMAIQIYTVARDDALRAKREIIVDKYQAHAFVREAAEGRALFYETLPGLSGVQAPEETSNGWLLMPDIDTPIGRELKADLDYVAELMEMRLWALERALGIFGYVSFDDADHYVSATAMADGTVLVSWPVVAEHDLMPGTAPYPAPAWMHPFMIDEAASQAALTQIRTLDAVYAEANRE